ncbi:LysE family transporter [Streptomyces sp. VRA16 Mangrove soil]|uniref:LysE family transporter n=1 Tax=Streptomyces sp. VRA16 Mangrove soil TaxID=2817434 RepID=UPI001A9CFDD2|nr:LysE family transporter [Streptomyces sp. VRA16 Mangrove soil]MBO1337915.1 LysE family transporter [Streptomyces sp. VRA16 Mangrove soil]
MSGALAAGLLAGYGIAVPVGAIGAYLVSLTARTNLRTGVCAALGVATADGVYALVAVVSGAALAPIVRTVQTPLRWGAAAVLLALAVHGAVRALRQRADRNPPALQLSSSRAYLGLLGLTLLNPMTVIYFAALVLGSGDTVTGLVPRTVFAVAAFTASASWQLLLAGGGALLGRALAGPRARLVTALLSSALIGGLAVRVVWAG